MSSTQAKEERVLEAILTTQKDIAQNTRATAMSTASTSERLGEILMLILVVIVCCLFWILSMAITAYESWREIADWVDSSNGALPISGLLFAVSLNHPGLATTLGLPSEGTLFAIQWAYFSKDTHDLMTGADGYSYAREMWSAGEMGSAHASGELSAMQIVCAVLGKHLKKTDPSLCFSPCKFNPVPNTNVSPWSAVSAGFGTAMTGGFLGHSVAMAMGGPVGWIMAIGSLVTGAIGAGINVAQQHSQACQKLKSACASDPSLANCYIPNGTDLSKVDPCNVCASKKCGCTADSN